MNMGKILLKSKEEFESFVNFNTGYQKGYGHVSNWLNEPEKYPCVCTYDIRYNGNGPDELDGDFVYLDDFGEYAGMNLDVAKIYAFIKEDMQNPYYDNADAERIHAYRDILKFIKDNINKDEK